MSNANMKYRSLTRKKNYEGIHARHKQQTDKNYSNFNNKKKNEIK